VKNVSDIVQELDRATLSLPVDQLLSELQIVVERISFSQVQNRQSGQNNDISIAQINMLFQDEISTEMLGYVQWLREHNLLTAVADNNGLVFLNYCIKKYKQLTQVRFITAIPISDTLKAHIRKSLFHLYPSGARLIFETNASLVAGFVIEDGINTVNKSLKHTMLSSLRPRVAQAAFGAPRG
jgi:F0F1-type ATP synthase delta subunit